MSTLPSSSSHKFSLSTLSNTSSGTGPAFPSSISTVRTHQRRPSRAERYEALVEGARELMERAREEDEGYERGGGQNGSVGLGLMEQEDQHAERISVDEWRSAVGNLLKVVDGMTRQLSTHDEIAAQLKIAQSNLTLAESHSEFLEETLRRRDSRTSIAMASRHSESGPPPAMVPGSRPRNLSSNTERPESNASLFGAYATSATEESAGSKAASFFRMPSKRKATPSTASNASSTGGASPMPPPSSVNRSSSSSPRLGDYSTTTTATTEDEADGSLHQPGKTVSQLTSELFALHSQVANLESACSSLRSSNVTLRRSADVLSGRCAELEKTKDDLMNELENLSVELFQEANTMVADERKLRSKADEDVMRLKGELESLTRDVELLRRSPASFDEQGRRISVGSTRTMHPSRANANGTPSLLSPTETNGSSPSMTLMNSSHSPNLSNAGGDSPVMGSGASVTSYGSRKWFSFGRGGSDAKRGDEGGESPNPGGLVPPVAPRMTRLDSNQSVVSTSSMSSAFFSAASLDDSKTDDDEEEEHVQYPKDALPTPTSDRPRPAPLKINPPTSGSHGEPSPRTPLGPTQPTSGSSLGLPPAQYPLPPSPAGNPVLSPNSQPTSYFPGNPTPPLPTISSFSPDSSPEYKPPPPIRPRPSPLLTQGSGGRPIAIHSFEGDSIAKSPKSPNELRWKDLVTSLPSSPNPSISPPTLSPKPSSPRFAEPRPPQSRPIDPVPRPPQSTSPNPIPNPPSISRTSSPSTRPRPTFVRTPSSFSVVPSLPSPTMPISASTSSNSIRSSAGTAEDLDDLMRNIEDMSISLFGEGTTESGL